MIHTCIYFLLSRLYCLESYHLHYLIIIYNFIKVNVSLILYLGFLLYSILYNIHSYFLILSTWLFYEMDFERIKIYDLCKNTNLVFLSLCYVPKKNTYILNSRVLTSWSSDFTILLPSSLTQISLYIVSRFLVLQYTTYLQYRNKYDRHQCAMKFSTWVLLMKNGLLFCN